jgi:hypothetical protein
MMGILFYLSSPAIGLYTGTDRRTSAKIFTGNGAIVLAASMIINKEFEAYG